MTEKEVINILNVFPLDMRDKGAFKMIEALRIATEAIKEVQKYRKMEEKLKSVYGECEGLLEEVVNGLVEYHMEGTEKPTKIRVLTNEHVDMWDAYKAIGTVEECGAAVEKQKLKKSKPGVYRSGIFACGSCSSPLVGDETFCPNCGCEIDWNDEK